MPDDLPTPFELFNAAIEAFRNSDLSGAVLLLRGAFFGNLYVAPLLTGEEFYPQRMWYPGAESEPGAAREYVGRYGQLWRAEPAALALLKEVWNDSLVRAELRSFLNLSRNLLHPPSESQFEELVRERERFLNPERLRRTQSEILSRLRALRLPLPQPGPRLGLVMLASRDPAASVEFYRKLLEVEPRVTSRTARGYAEFEFEGVHFAIHGLDQTADSDPYQLGPPPASLGWGAIFVFAVADFDRHYRNAEKERLEIVDRDVRSRGRRYAVLKDPSGYLVEITEEEPRGYDST